MKKTTSLFQRDTHTQTHKHNNWNTIAASCDVLRPHFSQPHTVLGVCMNSPQYKIRDSQLANFQPRKSWQHFIRNFSQIWSHHGHIIVVLIGWSDPFPGNFSNSDGLNLNQAAIVITMVKSSRANCTLVSWVSSAGSTLPTITQGLTKFQGATNPLFCPAKKCEEFQGFLQFNRFSSWTWWKNP